MMKLVGRSRVWGVAAALVWGLCGMASGFQAEPAQDAASPDAKAGARDDAPVPPAIGMATPPMKLINSLRLTTYNLGDLFLPEAEASEGRYVRSEDRCRAVADVIKALDSDVIALQGVTTEAALRWFCEAHLDGLGYEHIVSLDVGSPDGREQAVIGRFPLLDARVWPRFEMHAKHPRNLGNELNPLSGEPIRFVRPPLRVIVKVPSTDPTTPQDVFFTLFVVDHADGSDRAYWRDAEATGVLRLIGEHTRERGVGPVIVLGTLHALPSDHAVRTYLGGGLLDVYLKRGNITQAKDMTHESRRVLDYIFVNQPTMTYIVRRGPFVAGTPVRERDAGASAPLPKGYASSHMPLSIDLHPRNRGALALPEGFTH